MSDFPDSEYEELIVELMEPVVDHAGSYAEWLQFRRALERWMEYQEDGYDQAWEEREWEKREAA